MAANDMVNDFPISYHSRQKRRYWTISRLIRQIFKTGQLMNLEHVVFIDFLFMSAVNLYLLWLLQVMYGGCWIVHLDKFGIDCKVRHYIRVMYILTNIFLIPSFVLWATTTLRGLGENGGGAAEI